MAAAPQPPPVLVQLMLSPDCDGKRMENACQEGKFWPPEAPSWPALGGGEGHWYARPPHLLLASLDQYLYADENPVYCLPDEVSVLSAGWGCQCPALTVWISYYANSSGQSSIYRLWTLPCFVTTVVDDSAHKRLIINFREIYQAVGVIPLENTFFFFKPPNPRP